ncbi:MAG: hypothetical protein ACKO96_25595, partial [Flammeovirgaceae bacterium]
MKGPLEALNNVIEVFGQSGTNLPDRQRGMRLASPDQLIGTNKTFEELLKEFLSVEPLKSDDFLSAVEQLGESFPGNDMMIKHLKEWFEEKDDKDPYKQLKTELMVGEIFAYAKSIVQGSSQDPDPMKRLFRVVNFIGSEIKEEDRTDKFPSLIEQLRQSPEYRGGELREGSPPKRDLRDQLGYYFARMPQGEAKIILREAKRFRRLYIPE